LLSYNFREFGSVTALSVIEAANSGAKSAEQDQSKRGQLLLIPQVPYVNSHVPDLGAAELNIHLGPFDLKRLESYANNMVDYHVIMDLLPTVSSLYFEKRLGEEVKLGAVQCSILLALGLQRKTIEQVEVRSR
jgi:N-acetyltransferase 10